MKILEPAKAVVAAVVNAMKPKPLSREAIEEQRYRAAVNREGDRKRAERARLLDSMGVDDRWLPRRRGWLK